MRSLQMLGVAAQAEGLRLRRGVAGTVKQVAWIAAASVFGVAALVTGHVAAVAHLAPDYGIAGAAGMVAGADLVIAGGLALLSRRRRDPVAEEARMLRESMLASLTKRDAVRDVLGMALRSGPVSLLGAVAMQAISGWFRRR